MSNLIIEDDDDELLPGQAFRILDHQNYKVEKRPPLYSPHNMNKAANTGNSGKNLNNFKSSSLSSFYSSLPHHNVNIYKAEFTKTPLEQPPVLCNSPIDTRSSTALSATDSVSSINSDSSDKPREELSVTEIYPDLSVDVPLVICTDSATSSIDLRSEIHKSREMLKMRVGISRRKSNVSNIDSSRVETSELIQKRINTIVGTSLQPSYKWLNKPMVPIVDAKSLQGLSISSRFRLNLLDEYRSLLVKNQYLHCIQVSEIFSETIEYDMDENDSNWLRNINKERLIKNDMKISCELFEKTIDLLEKEWFFSVKDMFRFLLCYLV